MRQLFSKVISSPVGDLRAVVSEAGLVALLWQAGHPQRVRMGEVCAHGAHPVLLETERQLREYFAGDRRTFSLPLDASGTPFQRQVWRALALIPYGETRSYGELARQMGNPQLTRAVGSANGRNPISIVVPCHRVIGSAGELTGFAGGLEAKRFLLQLEGRDGRLFA